MPVQLPRGITQALLALHNPSVTVNCPQCRHEWDAATTGRAVPQRR
jgi:hypothetical protein